MNVLAAQEGCEVASCEQVLVNDRVAILEGFTTALIRDKCWVLRIRLLRFLVTSWIVSKIEVTKEIT